eukprot:TRINITY_DN12459_c0_g1_i1.p1 TRINITY_DN12459_c0_g1~~TRINITY_DN12459_c0_g1_i1.p1  ORF type:complete len:129 (-),score=23.15 TRINITY_DN12459_c0_g1_i1:47-433(-)
MTEGTSLGLPVALEAGIAVFFGWISGLIVLVIESTNVYVCAWCYQTIVVFLPISAMYFFFTSFAWYGNTHLWPFWYIGYGFGVLFFVTWIIMLLLAVINAEKEEFFPLPFIGQWCLAKAEARVSANTF